MRVDQVITLSLKVGEWLLAETDNHIRGVGSESFMSTSRVDKSCLFGESWKNSHIKSLGIDDGSLGLT